MAAPSKERAAGSNGRLSQTQSALSIPCKSSCMMRPAAAAHLANLVEGEELVAGGDVQAVASLGLLQGLHCIHVSVGLHLLSCCSALSTLQLRCLSFINANLLQHIYKHSFLQSPCMHVGCASTFTTGWVFAHFCDQLLALKSFCTTGRADVYHRWCMHSCMCLQTARIGEVAKTALTRRTEERSVR